MQGEDDSSGLDTDSAPSLAPGLSSREDSLRHILSSQEEVSVDTQSYWGEDDVEDLHSDGGIEADVEREAVEVVSHSPVPMFPGNPQGMSVSVADYMAELAEASRNYDGNDAQRHFHNYYGEFYDYDPEQAYTMVKDRYWSSHRVILTMQCQRVTQLR